MEDRDRILDYTKPVSVAKMSPDECSKNRKNFTQGYFYREIGRYKNAVPSEFQWAAEDKLIHKSTYEELKCQLPDHPRSTFLMVFSPDGKKVASTHGNHNVYVTDLTTGKNIQTLSGHPRTPWCIAFHPSSNQILASGCLAGQVRVWDLHGGSEVWTAESETVIASLAFHPVDRMLVIATYNELHFWDWSQPEPFAKCSTKSEREKVRYVSFDRLGNKLITGITNPVNVPSQWDRVSVVNSQPSVTSTTATTTTAASINTVAINTSTSTTSTSLNSIPSAIVTTQSSNEQGRSITFCYRHLMNQYNQLVSRYFDLSRSRITPTIDRGTDPMDLLDVRTTSESNTNNPAPSSSNSQRNPQSPLRFKITRSACRSYHSLNSRERLRLHSSGCSRHNSRSLSTNCLSTTTNSVIVSESSIFTTSNSNSVSTPSSTSTSRARGCAFGLGHMCLTFSPENSSNAFSSTSISNTTTASRAVTNPTYTYYSSRGIFSTRETHSNCTERSQFSVVRPYRLLFDSVNDLRPTTQRTSQNNLGEGSSTQQNNSETRSNVSFNAEQRERLRITRGVSILNSPERLRRPNRDSVLLYSPDGIEIEREVRRPTTSVYLRREESEPNNSTRPSPLSAEFSPGAEISRHGRSSSRFQLTPVDLRNLSPVRRFREETSSERGNFQRENPFLSHSLMHPRPVPRFQVRSRLVQDQHSQLHLIANRETHGLNLQNNQSLRRQLSFRPGGQFVLSRHSNSPFQPRVPHHIDSTTQMSSQTPIKNSSKSLRPEIPSLGSSFTASVSSNTNFSEAVSSSSTSSENTLFSNSVPNNLSFSSENNFTGQLSEQINRRLFNRVKMMLKDRIRNSLENASTDSTVNYSRISGESEADSRNLIDSEEGSTSRGMGPRGVDPLLSSVNENLDTSNDALLLPNSENSSLITGVANNIPNNSGLNIFQSELLDPWESEADNQFSLSSSLSVNEVLNGQSQSSQETQEGTQNLEQTQESSASNSSSVQNSSSPSPEFSMRQGIRLLSLHIENMQRLCWARIEILQLQKIRGMWEDLTNQIRHFHNIIQNRTAGEASTSRASTSSNYLNEVPSIRGLAISGGPVSESNSSSSLPSETTTNANDTNVNGRKELVESMVHDLFNESKTQKSKGDSSSNPQSFKRLNSEESCENSSENHSNSQANTRHSTNQAEEPQPGPSGLSTPSTSRGAKSPMSRNEYFKFRVYKLLLEKLQKSRRRKDVRESGSTTPGLFQRQNHYFRVRNSLRSRCRSHRHSRHLTEPSASRSRALNRKLEAILETWKKEKVTSKTSEPVPSTSRGFLNHPSTSGLKSSSSTDACQSCGQKKKPNKEFNKQKRRSVDSFSDQSGFGSASKLLKNNVGERSEAPIVGGEVGEDNSLPENEAETSSSSRTRDISTNELLKQMIQTMETMLRFQREAFRRTEELTGGRTLRSQSLSLPSSSDDSDSDQNDSNEQSEQFMRNLPRNFRSTLEVIVNLLRDVTQMRAKRLLGFMVKSLTQFFGKNFSNLNQVLDEQIFGLYILLHMALELTDLLLDQLNARSRDLERTWAVDNVDMNYTGSRDRNWLLSRPSVASERARERIRNIGRSSYTPSYGSDREDYRYRVSTYPVLRSHSRLISSRLSSSGLANTLHDRTFSTSFPNNFRRRRRSTARMSTTPLPSGWRNHSSRVSQTNNTNISTSTSSRIMSGNPRSSRCINFRFDQRTPRDEQNSGRMEGFDYEINNNNNSSNENNNSANTNNSNSNINNNNNNNNNNFNNDRNDGNNTNRVNGNRSMSSDNTNNNNNVNNNFLNYYFANNTSNSNRDNSNNNIIIVTGLNGGNEVINNNSNNNTYSDNRNNNEANVSRQSGTSASFLNQNSLPTLRSMELTLSRNESGDLSLRDERPIFWIRYGGNNDNSGSVNNSDSQSRVSTFTVPVVQVNDVPVSDVSMLNQPRHRPLSPVPRIPEDIWRWRAWRPRFLHPRYIVPNPFDDQDSNDVPENIHYYRILNTSAGSHLGVYTLDPMIITDAPLSSHHRIQAWDFSKMNIPDISDREANGVVPECKIHNDASVDVSNDGHLLVTLLPSGRLSVITMLGVYSLDWSSLGQLLYTTSFEQSAVSVSLSPTNRHLLVGLASRPVVVRDRTNMAQIFRLEGGRPSPNGGNWQSERGRLVHMRDLEQTREPNMSLNCIRWAPGAGQGLVYGTNTGQLKVLR